MGRNLDRRVELIFPVEDVYWRDIIKREVLDQALRDNTRARTLTAEGKYVHVQHVDGEESVEAQRITMQSRAKQPTKVPPREVIVKAN